MTAPADAAVEAVIFDLDGTLIKLPINYNALQNDLKSFSLIVIDY